MELSGVAMIFSNVPCRDNAAAVDTRTGADIHDIIRRPHGILIVLDDDQGIAQVPQTL